MALIDSYKITYDLLRDFIEKIKLYAPIHDIGKVGVNPSIVKKPGKLTTEEFEEIKTHVDIGYKMLKEAPISDIGKNIKISVSVLSLQGEETFQKI